MKKILALALVAVMCLSIFAGCQKKAKKDENTLILGLDDAFPPMGFVDENQQIVGFDIDVATEVCKRLGMKLKLQPISWKAKEQELNTKKIDCIWNGMSWSEELSKNLLLSESYMKNNQVAVVLASKDYDSVDDLAGKKVACQNGSTASTAIDENAEFKNSLGEIIYLDNNVQAMLDLETSGVDAVILDEIVARYYMSKDNYKDKFKVLDGVMAEEEYVIGFRKDDKELCDKIIKTIKEMAADGKLAEISNKWFGKDITTIK